MSRYMQIDVRVIPFYDKRFESRFPQLADLFRRMSYLSPLEKDMSLYELADHLVSMSRDPDAPPELKKKIGSAAMDLLAIKREAREHLLARRLDELDEALYRLEDRFMDLEGEL